MNEDFAQRVSALHAVLETTDYYRLLGIPRGAGSDALRDAYYHFASVLHPDLFRDAEEPLKSEVYAIFKRAAEAYRVLGDPTLRKAYDQALADGRFRLSSEELQPRKVASTEPTFTSLSGGQLWREACAAEAKGDLKRAKLQLTLLLGHERDHPVAAQKLADIQTRLKAGKSP